MRRLELRNQQQTSDRESSKASNGFFHNNSFKPTNMSIINYWKNHIFSEKINVIGLDSYSAEDMYDVLKNVSDAESLKSPIVKLFLDTHFNQYYYTLKGDQVVQPFFTFLEGFLIARAKDLKKPVYDLVNDWIVSHPKYVVYVDTPPNSISFLPADLDLTGFDESQMRVALLFSYYDVPIKKENAAEIANRFGFTSKTSGMQIMRKYDTVASALKRVEIASDKEIHHRVRDIEAIKPFLSQKGQEDADKDLKTLRLKTY